MYQNSKKHLARHQRSPRHGVAIVEITAMAVMLSTLAFGTVEFGDYFYVRNILEQAAREGARAAVPPNALDSQVTTAINGALANAGFSTHNITISVTNSSGQSTSVAAVAVGAPIQVSVSGPWSSVGNGFRPLGLIGNNKQVSGICIMHKGG